jgi:hypothetical protein
MLRNYKNRSTKFQPEIFLAFSIICNSAVTAP